MSLCLVMELQDKKKDMRLPAEWEPQSGIQLTWPHKHTDWAYMLEEVQQCFICIAREIAQREYLFVVTPYPEDVRCQLECGSVNMERVRLMQCDTNDTWARDHGAIALTGSCGIQLLDFTFNGWGLKFAADKDNLITRRACGIGALKGQYVNKLGFVLEGGSIESDGNGTLLTTSECLLSANRNAEMGREEIADYLRKTLNLKQILWVDHGFLLGDDTDSHIDTLARFCPNDTIVYVQCLNKNDEHYEPLKQMELQLQTFRTLANTPYKLLPLPLPEKITDEKGERLPATYANFLVVNGAVLYPTYGQTENDQIAAKVLQQAFPAHEIIGINCRALIKQHGSLHCITMQYPVGVL